MINQKITKNKLDKRSKYLRSLICKILLSTDRGHFGSAMSLVEILRVLYDEIIFFDSIKPQNDKRDRVILSKGHGCLALYAILADKGFFPMKELEKAFSKNALLGGHPENHIPGVEVSTGALGHGFSLAVGMAKAAKIKKKNHKIYVIVGDGELNEGANWEAALSASQNKLGNLKVIVDCNKIQSHSFTKDIINVEPLAKKFDTFGFDVSKVDGHNILQLKKNFYKFSKSKKDKPSITICNTVKGKGFKFAENNPLWHHRNFFLQEDIKKINESLK
tara:strand:+ start:189 stop:1016 length:828 start_codon:yes stop_codon:yes gene_type:complete